MSNTSFPTPPIVGSIVHVTPSVGEPYRDRVTGFDATDGAVFLAGGEIVANHLGEDYSPFELVRER
jgi:hypothetical protein